MKIYGFQNNGYQGQITWIETDIRNGFPGFDIVCLPLTDDTIAKLLKTI